MKDHYIADPGCVRKTTGTDGAFPERLYHSLLHTRAPNRPCSSISMFNFSNPIFAAALSGLPFIILALMAITM
jgi:hypothetical protein